MLSLLENHDFRLLIDKQGHYNNILIAINKVLKDMQGMNEEEAFFLMELRRLIDRRIKETQEQIKAFYDSKSKEASDE